MLSSDGHADKQFEFPANFCCGAVAKLFREKWPKICYLHQRKSKLSFDGKRLVYSEF